MECLTFTFDVSVPITAPVLIYIYAFSDPLDWTMGEISAVERTPISITVIPVLCDYTVRTEFQFVIVPALDVTFLLSDEI